MGALSYNQGRDLTKAAINVLQKLELHGASASPNYDTLYDVLIAANLGDLQAEVGAAAAAHRAGLSALLAPDFVRAILAPPVREWAVACGAPEGPSIGFDKAMERIRDYHVTNTLSINSREFSRGSASAGGGNTGNGTINRLNVDESAFALDGGHGETKTFTCLLDQNNVEKHHEEFEVKSPAPEPDFVKWDKSGIVAGIRCLTSRDSEAYIQNPTFSQYGGTTQPSAGSEQAFTATTSLTGWTVTTAANASMSLGPSDAAYRDLVGEANRYTVRFTADNAMSQQLNSFKRPTFDRLKPYFMQVAIYRASNCDGTLTLRMGATTRAITMSTLTSSAWNVCTLTMDSGLYHKNFTTSDAVVSFTLASRTTGSLYLDDIVMSPMFFMDGAWWAMVGGATPFKRGDTFTVADTVSATRGVISYWLHHRSGYALQESTRGFCIPVNASGAETVTDPT